MTAAQSGPFDPRDFVDLAAMLARRPVPTQADLRTALSRAYYGIFLHARERLGSITSQDESVHARVIADLRSTSRERGDQLDRLRRARVQADHELRHWANAQETRLLVALAETLMTAT